MDRIRLRGKLIIEGQIEAVTGLHIGGAQTGLEIGGVDNIVVRDPLSKRPCIPGSSLKGKMRSLMERRLGLPLNRYVRRGKPEVRIHECEEEGTYKTCDVCRIFGVAGERTFATPTRLYVRDTRLAEKSAEDLERLETEYPYTEIKWEAAIDRITSAAVPRQFERVPAGAVFGPLTMVFNFYEGENFAIEDDVELLRRLFEAMELLEDDYLGGMGSRGYGQVKFQGLTLTLKTEGHYTDPEKTPAVEIVKDVDVSSLRAKEEEIIGKIKEHLTAAKEGSHEGAGD